jgi:hypothetical protein
MISSIHSRLRSRKIANPLYRFLTRRQVIRSNIHEHIGRDTPGGGTSNAVASQARHAAVTVKSGALANLTRFHE